MTNPFYVNPGNDMYSGLMGLSQTVGQVGQQMEARRKQEAQMERLQAAQDAAMAARGNPSMMADVMIQYPEMADVTQKLFNFTNEQTKPIVEQTYARVLANPENAKEYLSEGIMAVKNAGGSPDMMTRDLQSFFDDPEAALKLVEMGVAAISPQVYKEYDAQRKLQEDAKIGDIPSGTREFNDLLEKAASEDELVRRSARIKLGLDPRATGSAALTITELGNVQDVSATEEQLSAGREAGKLTAQYKMQPKIRAAVEAAAKGAAALADKAIEDQSNLSTFQVYDTGMSGVAEALGATGTGPFVGRLPAITTEQQIAEGTIAAMAPVLKQMFRAAGEGAFTDYDQKLLLDMMPTRKDTPEAVQAKLKNIDAIVRAKLGISEGVQSKSLPQSTPSQAAPQTVNWADLQ